MSGLPVQQRHGITRIVAAEADGIGVTRLLKTPYSCQWCGLVAGESGEARDARKAKLATHEESCRKNHAYPWRFIVSLSTYYRAGGWLDNPLYTECLEQARRETLQQAYSDTLRTLQLTGPLAALELRRQVVGGSTESARLRASVAVLDRIELASSADSSEADPARDLSDDELDAEIERLS